MTSGSVQLNERSGTDFNQADQLFFDQIVEVAVADEILRQAAAVNPEDKVELVCKHLLETLFVERMDQNEDIFVRFMNDVPFQKIVTAWMASEAYRRIRASTNEGEGGAAPPHYPAQLSVVEPTAAERYAPCVPLVPFKVAAGAFGDPQDVADEGFEWVTVEARHRLRRGVFVAQVVGKSMEPAIPDGASCLFSSPVEGSREGKIVLVQLADAIDPETGHRSTVKRYQATKASQGSSWRHERITLKPINPDFPSIVLTGTSEGSLTVIAELIEVLGSKA